MARQQDLAEAAFADHLEEVEVARFGRRVGGRAEVDLLGRAGLLGGTGERDVRAVIYEPQIQ